jgi:hypothetical protein
MSPKDRLKDAKPLLHEQTCEVCLKDFTSRRSDAKTCSPRCRKALSRSAVGHLDRLERVAASFDKAQRRKESYTFRRSLAKVFDRPMHPARKRPPSIVQELKRTKARRKHFDRVIKAAIESSDD